jgi:nucleoside-diphosphate-sugar epimerase
MDAMPVRRVALLGSNSRVAKALAARNSLPLLGISRGSADSATSGRRVVLSSYDELKADHLSECDTLVYCLGVHQGSLADMAKINCDLALAVAAKAHDAGVAHMIYLSSFSVFGTAPHIEGTTPIAPVTDYGRSRALAEESLTAFSMQTPRQTFAVSTLRLPMLYGYGNSKLEKLVAFGRRLGFLPCGGPDVRRSMLHYDSVAKAIEKLVDGPKRAYGAIADETPFSYKLLTEMAQSSSVRLALPVLPAGLRSILFRINPSLSASLFADSYLDPAANMAPTLGLQTRLAHDLKQMFSSESGR